MGSKLLLRPSDPGMSGSEAGQGCGLEPFQGIDFRCSRSSAPTTNCQAALHVAAVFLQFKA
ncbi:hypothetical protein [Streptomyces spiralis]|uniref:hypothetical protein n=1 Tax=Streptomyces spiralis TaxID=66376 RepID=UPI0034083F4A